MSHGCDWVLEISPYGGAKWLPHGNDFTEKLVGVKGKMAVSMPNGAYIFGIGGNVQFLPNGQKEWKAGKLVDYSNNIFVDSWS